jgi:hypothetical protein
MALRAVCAAAAASVAEIQSQLGSNPISRA